MRKPDYTFKIVVNPVSITEGRTRTGDTMAKQKAVSVPENTRIAGTALWTPLSQLPERWTNGPHSREMTDYLSRRWTARSYGWYRRTGDKAIEYNRAWVPEGGQKQDRYHWVEHPADGLRFVGNVHEIRGSGDGNLPYFDRALVDHNGWFIDSYQDETVCGQVYQMPARGGERMYVPAVSDPWNDAAIVDFHSSTDAIREAISWADSMAEQYAEQEREYRAKEEAERRIEEIEEEIKTARSGFLALARELRANCDKVSGMEELRKLVRQEYRRMRGKCRRLAKERGKLKDNYWTAVEDY